MIDKIRKPAKDSEAEIWNAIAAFEKILEALPNDRVSLETLVEAYEKVGDRTRSIEHAIRLANVCLEEADEDAAREMLGKLSDIAPDDPRLKDLADRLKVLTPSKMMADVLEDDDEVSSRSLNIAAEITFAWNLLQVNKITQDEYSNIVHDLSESSARGGDVPVSTLHVLYDRNFSNMNAIMAFVSSSCNMPFISLDHFEIQSGAASLVPLSFVVNRCALPFEIMESDLLVAILNPYDDQLPMEIETLTGKLSHFYFVAPDDFDRALEKIRQAQNA